MLRALSRANWLKQFWTWLTGVGLTAARPTGAGREREAPQSAPVANTVQHLPALFTPRLDASSLEQQARKSKPSSVANCDWRFAARLRAVAEVNVPTSRKSTGARERSAVAARAATGVTASIAAQQALRFAPARTTEVQHSRAAFVSHSAASNVVVLRQAQHHRPTQRRGFVGERLAA
jgi:hypothetical protein